MNLKDTPVSFGTRMNSQQVNNMLKNNRTMPLGTKLPKNLERQISPNFFQRIVNFFRKLF